MARIFAARCAGCHREGGPAPFSLGSVHDARNKARQIALVTGMGLMPPWKPVPGYGEFQGARRLPEGEFARLKQWAMEAPGEEDPEGVPIAASAPALGDWQIGKPDLVLKATTPFEIPADGPDLSHTFVIPLGLPEDRWARAVEFRTLNPRIARHARFELLQSSDARLLETAVERSGSAMMRRGGVRTVDLDGWVAGGAPYVYPEGLPKPLRRGMALALMVHYHPSGKPETDQPELGIYFSSMPPTRYEASIPLGSDALDLPAGAASVRIQDSVTLPAAMEALGLFPHAHYLCREIEAEALLPDGSRRPLLWIRDWDYGWQEPYHFAAPVQLPAGTRIAVAFTYDNSTGNPRNPNEPPRRVRAGTRLTDEMCELELQVASDSAADIGSVVRAIRRRPMRGMSRSRGR